MTKEDQRKRYMHMKEAARNRFKPAVDTPHWQHFARCSWLPDCWHTCFHNACLCVAWDAYRIAYRGLRQRPICRRTDVSATEYFWKIALWEKKWIITKKRGKTVHCSDYRIHSSSRNLVGRGVHIPVWRTGGVDAYTFCPWIHKGGNCIFYMLFCVPLIRKWTQAETDPKVGRQRLENDSIRGRNVNAV